MAGGLRIGMGLGLTHARSRAVLIHDYRLGMPAGATYARTGAAVALTLAGLLPSFATDVPPRTDRGLEIEEALTNLMPAYTVAGTGYQNANTTSSAGPTSPLGSAAVTLTTTGSSEGGPRRTGVGMSPGTTYLLTAIPRAGTIGQMFLRNLALAGNQGAQSAYFNLTTGVPGTKGSSVIASGMVPLADGSHFCWATGTTPASLPGDLIDVKFDGQPVGRTLHLAQFDLQAVSSLRSPIVTGAGSATRGLPTFTEPVPVGRTKALLTYADATTTLVTGLTPGGTFDVASAVIGAGKGRFATSELVTREWLI